MQSIVDLNDLGELMNMVRASVSASSHFLVQCAPPSI